VTRDQVAASIVALVLDNEGGVADVGDGMGLTRWGQTVGWCHEFSLPIPRTKDDAAVNYRHWLDKTRLIELCDVLDALAVATVDWAVNSGHRRAIQSLQTALGSLQPDGVIGDLTVERISHVNRKNVAARILCDRNAFLFGLVADNPARNAQYARGWARRMSGQILWLVA